MDTVLVTGAGGFVGGHLVRRLRDEGVGRLRAVDAKPLDEWWQLQPDVENVRADLELLEACRRVTRGVDTVFNLAADMGGMGFIEHHKARCMLSVLVSTHMLVAAREVGVERYFYASSACVYAEDKQSTPAVTGLREEDAYPAMPEDGYGWEKLFSERMAGHFRRGLRPGDPRRPLPQRVRAPRELGRRPGEGARGDLPQSGRRRPDRRRPHRDLGRRPADPQLHLHRRLHRGHASARRQRRARAPQRRQRSPGHRQRAGRHGRGRRRRHPEAESVLDAPQGVRGRNSDNTRIRRLLGWEPQVGLEEGLAATYAWVHDQVAASLARA